jgi:hypothetical protein
LRHLPAALREIPAAAWSCETVRVPTAPAARARASTVAFQGGGAHRRPGTRPVARPDATALRRGRAISRLLPSLVPSVPGHADDEVARPALGKHAPQGVEDYLDVADRLL